MALGHQGHRGILVEKYFKFDLWSPAAVYYLLQIPFYIWFGEDKKFILLEIKVKSCFSRVPISLYINKNLDLYDFLILKDIIK